MLSYRMCSSLDLSTFGLLLGCLCLVVVCPRPGVSSFHVIVCVCAVSLVVDGFDVLRSLSITNPKNGVR